ncbi:MAG: manganese catalase family protein [Oscillospiraceae bacterium]|nr:manganese catalase family protein [Oscillospiraceae bacterium]
MFKHEKQYLQPVRIDRPNPAYAALLQEQLGGPQGEMKSAMQYFAQSMRMRDPEVRDLFMDIAAEELCHMEMVAAAVSQLNGEDPDKAEPAPGNVEAKILSGGAPMLANASGYLWTAAYVNVTGDPAADILSDIAAELRAKAVYQHLYRQIDDRGVREMIDFLLNREEAHNTLLREAFEKIRDKAGILDHWGETEDSRIYFDLSRKDRHDSKHFGENMKQPPEFRS